MTLLKSINIGLSFLLELAMLAALGYWGFKTGQGRILGVLLGLGAPVLAAVLWGFFAAPKAATRLHGLGLAVFEIVLLGTGAAALFAGGQTRLAWIYALALALNRVLWIVWGQE